MGKRKTNEGGAKEERATDAPRPRSKTLNGGLDPREMAQRSAEARRAKAAERELEREDAAMTVRQRLAVALSSELTTEDWRKVVRAARDKADTAALARMADQAFGKPQPEEEADEAGSDAAKLTRAERATLIAALLREEETQQRPAGDSRDPREETNEG